MDFKEIVMGRYAAKKFDGKKVPEDKIKELLELIRYSASGLNSQPWKIKVVTDQKIKDALRLIAHNQEQISTCSHLLVLCAETDTVAIVDRSERMMKALEMPDEKRTMILGFVKAFFQNMPAEKALEWARCHVYLALGNAINGAKSLGLDSCPMAGFDSSECARILGLPAQYEPTVICPVGYAADVKPAMKVRAPLEEILL